MPAYLKIKLRRPLLFIALTTLLASIGFMHLGIPAAADPPNSVLTTIRYCKNHLSNAADSICNQGDMNKARAIFTDSCNKKADCIEKGAESVVDEVASKKPKNAQDAKDALTAAIKDKTPSGGGPSGGGPGPSGGGPTAQSSNCDSNSCDLISLYVNPAISLLSVMVGLVVAGSLIMAGIQYTSASGDPQKISAAKSRITNTLMAFLVYIFLFAFMNFLIPGGLFG